MMDDGTLQNRLDFQRKARQFFGIRRAAATALLLGNIENYLV